MRHGIDLGTFLSALPHYGEITPHEALQRVARELGDDEVRVLTNIAGRLREGARVYGRLRLDSDPRDFRGKEAREELEDFVVYMACAFLKGAGR